MRKPKQAEPINEADGAELPTITVDVDEERVNNDAIDALARSARIEKTPASRLFHRVGQLIQVVHDGASKRDARGVTREGGGLRIGSVTAARLGEVLSSVASYESVDGRLVHQPARMARAILDRGMWPALRRLAAIAEVPVLRGDGSIFCTPGYDDESEIFYWPSATFPAVPDAPTAADVERARDALLEVVCDFPFERNEHRAAWLAGLLTPLARAAFTGPAPLFAIDKNVRGAGGTLAADAIGVIVSGRAMPHMTNASDKDEEAKRITSIAIAADPFVLIDNVAGMLGTDALDAALTAETWRARILSRSEMGSWPLLTTWYASGNNMVFGADTLRRICHIRINSPDENPEGRTDFRHPNLLAWLKVERPRLVAAALTILRAHAVAGRPTLGMRPWGSFESWSEVVRGAIVWCGLPDPALTREELTSAADDEAALLGNVLRAWRSAFGERPATIAEALEPKCDPHDMAPPMIRQALAELAPPPKAGMLPNARAIAAKFKRARARVIDGLAFDIAPGNNRNGQQWIVRGVARGDSGDKGDSVSPPKKFLRKKIRGASESPTPPKSPRTLDDELNDFLGTADPEDDGRLSQAAE